MKNLIKHIVYTIIAFASVITIAQNQTLFDEGNTFYNNGKYFEAIEKYKAILDNGQESAELYFNLGNANYKLNHIAPSVYYYEKALQLDPNNKDIQNNLAFAKNMTIDAIEKVPELGLSKFLRQAVNALNFDVWAILSVAFIVLFVVFFLMYYFTDYTNKKRFMFIGSLASVFLCVLFLVFAFKKYNIDQKDKPAIVFAQESLVRTDPNLSGSEAFTLHEGTKVQVLDTVNNWKKIKIADGKTGWIVSDDIKLLNDF